MKDNERKKQKPLIGDGFGMLSNIVYSTGAIGVNEEKMDDDDEIQPEMQNLRIWFEKSGRGGKAATLIKGFEGSDQKLEELGQKLRKQLGTGGSVKEGEIILQGNVGQKVFDLLQKLGYKKTKKAGGF